MYSTLIKGEYSQKHNLFRKKWYILHLKLHVSAFTGHLKVSKI